MKIRPLQDRVIVKRLEEEGKTKGGIIKPINLTLNLLESAVKRSYRNFLI